MSNLSTVKAIGAALRRTETAVPAIIATLPEGFDPSARGAVAEAVHAWACGDEERPAVKKGSKGNQKATDYGRGVDALTKAVKATLAPEKATDWLRLVRQAVESATNHEVTPDAILAAVSEVLAAPVES